MKKILISVLVLALASSLVFVLVYNKPHRNPEKEEAVQVNALDLFNAFESNEAEANTKYLDKVLEITGVVSEITANQEKQPIVVLESGNMIFGVRCTMQHDQANTHIGDTVSIRGICTGYLSDVIITNGTISKQ